MQIVTAGIDLAALAARCIRPPLFEPGAPFWDDPHIATEMLKAHLDPDTDAASRKPETIAQIVAWLVDALNLKPGDSLLDLGCGPGLYARQFAARGIRVTGVDLSANSIAYARAHDPASHYICADYRALTLEAGAFDAAVLIYGDLCVLGDADRDAVLALVRRSLRPSGRFAFDVTTPVQRAEHASGQTWTISDGPGFWKPTAHLTLCKTHFYAEHETELEQYLVLDAAGTVSEYRVWTHYYTRPAIEAALAANGWHVEGVYNDLMGTPADPDSPWLGVVAAP